VQAEGRYRHFTGSIVAGEGERVDPGASARPGIRRPDEAGGRGETSGSKIWRREWA